jgi:hypothetical protein
MKRLIATLAAFALLAPIAGAANNPYVKVHPTTVSGGNSVKVFGWVGNEEGEDAGERACGRGDRVTIYSNAFAGAAKHTYRHIPALYAKVDKHHHFSTSAIISSNVAPRTYKIKAVCQGDLFAQTKLTVTQFY